MSSGVRAGDYFEVDIKGFRVVGSLGLLHTPKPCSDCSGFAVFLFLLKQGRKRRGLGISDLVVVSVIQVNHRFCNNATDNAVAAA